MDWHWVVLIAAGIAALIGLDWADTRFDFTPFQGWLAESAVFGLFMYLMMLKLSGDHRYSIITGMWIFVLQGIKPLWKWLRREIDLRKTSS